MSGNRNTHDATFTSTDSPQSTDYTNFEFSELLEFDEWAEEDLITMVSGYPMNLSGENGAAGNNNYIGTSSRLEAPDDRDCGSGRGKKDGKHKVAFRTMSEIEILNDGFKWRKYGKKMVKNSPNPRNYYKCSFEGCAVKKRVERDTADPRYVITTYEGVHNHQGPSTC